MSFLLKYKKIIIIVLLIAVGLFLYSKFVVSDKPITGVTKESTGKAPGTVSGTASPTITASDESAKSFAAQLRTLSGVQIKTELFSDPAYTILREDKNVIPPMPAGRPNPFAAIGTDADAGFQITSVGTTSSSTSAPIRSTRRR